MMQIALPSSALVLLVGPSGSGKSTFARRLFAPTEIVSSDHCRALICDEESDQSVTVDAFDIAHLIVLKRMAAARLTIVDATNVYAENRRPLLQLARDFLRDPCAIVFDFPLPLCQARDHGRPDRRVGAEIIHQQHLAVRDSLPHLGREGFKRIYTLTSPEQADAVTIVRERSEHEK